MVLEPGGLEGLGDSVSLVSSGCHFEYVGCGKLNECWFPLEVGRGG